MNESIDSSCINFQVVVEDTCGIAYLVCKGLGDNRFNRSFFKGKTTFYLECKGATCSFLPLLSILRIIMLHNNNSLLQNHNY